MEIRYRPEIDGLRTIAVLSVLIYHAEFLLSGHKILPGGFFGVDVFFVISGFLITSLMMTEFNKTGSISITKFYWRRARRLLPALLTVMLVSMPFAWKYLLPSQLIDFSKSLISSLLFGSNFFWYFSLQEYGAESGLLKPFLHTWSLAVEEQYYIIFPLILLATYKWYKSHSVILLTTGLLASLLFAEWMTAANASFSFYMLPSRFWELLAGSLIASMLYLFPQTSNDTLLGKTMPKLGLLLIFYSFAFIGFDSGHPGFITLTPVIGVMLIIYFASEKELVTRTLSSKYFVFVGLISYSLYLWHYPIFSFFRIAGLFDSGIGRITAISLTFLLSSLSARYIENPLRKKDTIRNKNFFLLVILLIFVIASFSLSAIKNEGFSARFNTVYGFLKYERDNRKLGQNSWKTINKVEKNSFDSSKIKILITGNSHAKDIFNAFYQNPGLYGEYDFRRGKIKEIRHFDRANPENFEASTTFFLSEHYVQSQVIIVSTRYNKSDLDGLPYLIERSLRDGKKVIIFGNTVEFTDINGKILKYNVFHTPFDSMLRNLDTQGLLDTVAHDETQFNEFRLEINTKHFEVKRRFAKLNSRVRRIAERFNVPYVDKYRFICEEKDSVCFGLTENGHKSFYDYGHFTLEGARFFGERMAHKGVLKLLKQKTSEE